MLESLVRLIMALPKMMMMAASKEPIVSLFPNGTGWAIGAGNVSMPFFIFRDAGKGDYLNVLFKVNHLPYGETFFHYATGRFCKGRIPPDFIAENANLHFTKPYLVHNFSDYTNRATFTSGGAGILPETAPGALYLELQVSFFEEVTERLKKQMGDSDAQKLISRAVYHISMGGDDSVALEKASLEANTTISPHYKEVFVGWVIGNLTTSLKRLYRLGGRQFSCQNVAPIRCVPSSRFMIGTDAFWDDANMLVEMHNEELTRLLARGSRRSSLFDYYTTLLDRTMNFSEFGFKVGEIAGCGSGAYNGNLNCGIEGDNFTLCRDPNDVFFDCAHSTEKVNRHLSSLMWSGKPPVIGPHNLKMLDLLNIC